MRSTDFAFQVLISRCPVPADVGSVILAHVVFQCLGVGVGGWFPAGFFCCGVEVVGEVFAVGVADLLRKFVKNKARFWISRKFSCAHPSCWKTSSLCRRHCQFSSVQRLLWTSSPDSVSAQGKAHHRFQLSTVWSKLNDPQNSSLVSPHSFRFRQLWRTSHENYLSCNESVRLHMTANLTASEFVARDSRQVGSSAANPKQPQGQNCGVARE